MLLAILEIEEKSYSVVALRSTFLFFLSPTTPFFRVGVGGGDNEFYGGMTIIHG